MGRFELEFRGTPRFEIKRRLGTGAMGLVYEAYDRERSAPVALKVLRRADAPMLARFKREFRALQNLEHPNLVSLGELFAEGGEWFFTMELIKGSDFLTYVRRGSSPETRAAPAQPADADSPTLAISEPPSEERSSYPGSSAGHRAQVALVDETRLRDALRQLALGIASLHLAGNVHRDIKPSNILVTESGRVVLLDFGLVTYAAPEGQSSRTNIVGTVEYMAPEQSLGKEIGTATDWYAMGVVLYEALTGQLPHTGKTMLDVLMKKQQVAPLPPRDRVSTVPEDLDELCMELLHTDPERRPSDDEILERLGADDVQQPEQPSSTITSFTQTTPFVGRTNELALLRKAYDDSREGLAVSVFVHGESGLGKTELVRRFTRALAAEDEQVLVLAGRCYERESVPYNAFDGIADSISRHMRRLSRTESAALLPPRAGFLPQLFPAFQEVESIARAPIPRLTIDPQERRARMFRAFRQLLVRLAEQNQLVLAIDDLQWAGADSLILLREVLHPSTAPELLLLGTARPGVEDLLAQTSSGEVRHLHLGELPLEQSCELVAQLAPRLKPDQARAIADEASGHPLFIQELVRRLDEEGPADAMRLDDALWSRVSTLEAQPRALLEVLAVAGAPIAQETAAQAAGLAFLDYERAAKILRIAFLARTGGRGASVVETYHDRIREAVIARLEPENRVQHHRKLALALERFGAAATDPQLLVRHCAAAGEAQLAAKHAETAARRASEMSAFDQAAELLKTALKLGQHDSTKTRELRRLLGEALASAGRGAEAAEAFLQAATDGDPQSVLELQVRAGSELLRSGRVDEGVEVLRPALAEAGVYLARSRTRAALSLLLRRAYTRIRGLGFRPRTTAQVSSETLTRIDAYHAAATGLAMVDTVRGAYAQTQHLLSALRYGDEFRVARALSYEGGFRSIAGPRAKPRVDRILATVREIAGRLKQPYLSAVQNIHTALAAYQCGDWKTTLERSQIAERTIREQCTGAAWELASAQIYSLWSQYWLGAFRELARQAASARREAIERGDRYALVSMSTGLPAFADLVADKPAGARERIAEAADRWTHRGYHLEHYWSEFALIHCDLYGDDPVAANQRAETQWRALKRVYLLRIAMVRAEMLHLRARCALAAALATRDRRRYLGLAAKMARKLQREQLSWCRPAAALLRSGILTARGRPDEAVDLLERAEKNLLATDTNALAAAARRMRGELLGGDDGRALIDESEAWMTERGVVAPARLARFFAPGFIEPESTSSTAEGAKALPPSE